MKLLIITNYLGNKGGLGRYSSEITKAIMDFPLEVKVLSEAKSTDIKYEFNLLKPVFYLPKWKMAINLIKNLFITRRMAKDFDIIHAHDGWPYAIYALFAVMGTKKKLFITGIGTYGVLPLKKGIRGYLLKKSYMKAKSIFCISDYVKDRISKYCPKANLRTVFMGTTKLPEISDELRSQYFKEYNLKDRFPIILTVGDIKRRKGQLDTLLSLNLIKNKYPNFYYIMVGASDDTYYINQMNDAIEKNSLKDNVRIISNMYDDKILSFFYSSCNIFMLNSNNDHDHFEGFGLVLLEAAQFGKPVIGSRGCGIESALKDCYNGLLANQGDHVDISNKIISILEGDLSGFSENSRDFYKKFSWDITAREYYKDYIK